MLPVELITKSEFAAPLSTWKIFTDWPEAALMAREIAFVEDASMVTVEFAKQYYLKGKQEWKITVILEKSLQTFVMSSGVAGWFICLEKDI